jgi:hypothetical protein
VLFGGVTDDLILILLCDVSFSVSMWSKLSFPLAGYIKHRLSETDFKPKVWLHIGLGFCDHVKDITCFLEFPVCDLINDGSRHRLLRSVFHFIWARSS